MKRQRIMVALGISALAGLWLVATSCEKKEDPKSKTATGQKTPAMEMAPAAKNIVETALAAGNFKTLASALTAAGLADTLKGPGPFTVFAPTDEAFKKLPAGTLPDLLLPENKDKLVGILTYHVVSGRVMAADVVKLTAAKTLQGKELAVKSEGGSVLINNAKVTQTDILCSNGVIHVIDTVLIP